MKNQNTVPLCEIKPGENFLFTDKRRAGFGVCRRVASLMPELGRLTYKTTHAQDSYEEAGDCSRVVRTLQTYGGGYRSLPDDQPGTVYGGGFDRIDRTEAGTYNVYFDGSFVSNQPTMQLAIKRRSLAAKTSSDFAREAAPFAA